MSKLTLEPEQKVKYTMCQANQLNARLPSHAVAHFSQIKPGATPSNVNSRPIAHPMAPLFLIREIH